MDPKKLVEDHVGEVIEHSADANYEFGQKLGDPGSSDADVWTDVAVFFIMIGHFVCLLVAVAVAALSSLSFYRSIAYCVLIPMGIVSIITGRAVLKPSRINHAAFSGWKGRIIGIGYLVMAWAFIQGR
ncbi:MAG: hypothetical protein FWD57_10425 [Polyangiaceae bacterium]|nr:hypothetical protein [Polyangiaceae bacterium]